jgi:hypothetical protein
MKLLNKLPGYTRGPPGLERVVLARMPMIFAGGVGLLTAPSMLLRLGDWGMHPFRLDEIISKTDIYAAAGLLLYCNLAIATTLGAIIVWLMKGPAYVADAYPLNDATEP